MKASILRKLSTALLMAAAPWLAAAQSLTVATAVSLNEAVREVSRQFEALNPAARVRLNAAASGVLVQQIVRGAPVDVLLSADPLWLDRGVQAGVLVADSRRDFARNELLLVAPMNSRIALGRLDDLLMPQVQRIAIGKPDVVPAGRYARDALDAAGLTSRLQARFVFADSVRQVLDYVSRGEVEAGFVYRTDAIRMSDRVRVVATLSATEVLHPAAVVSDSRQPALARAYVEHLLSPAAQAVFRRHGFGPP